MISRSEPSDARTLKVNISGTCSCSGFSLRWNLMPPDDVFSANCPDSVVAFSRRRVVTGAPKQAAKASPYASMLVSSIAPSPRIVIRMPSSFF
eukprot:4790042-Prymnesium_polylepis.1